MPFASASAGQEEKINAATNAETIDFRNFPEVL